MKTLALIALSIALYGCAEPSSAPSPLPANDEPINYAWYGDSRCVPNKLIPDERKFCNYGRQLVQVEEIDDSYELIVIHLGHNDMKTGKVDPLIWGAHLAYLIDGIEDKVWCILPTSANHYVEPHIVAAYRQQMLSVCSNTKDPQIEGLQKDKIHYTQFNYGQVKSVLDEILIEFKEGAGQ